MPTCRRKRVVLTEPSPALLEAHKKDPSRDVFYLERTGELFETYDAYATRMSYYRQKQFQCEVTGKSGLNYFEALDSEELEARTMHSRFPEPLKAPILKAVQWQVIGRLDHLIEAVYERFKDRYFLDERVFVDIQGERYYARVMQVFPPRSAPAATTSSPFPPKPEEEDQIHKLAGDLKLPVKDANVRDDPQKYLYKIQIHEDNKEKATASPNDEPEAEKSKWSGSLMEVQCSSMSRDRLTFSKSILRRFIRDCVDRDAAVASPWVVKKFIADKYGVSSVMPDETRKGVENLKKGEMEKRKKAWEEKEGPSTKKQKKDPEPEKVKEPTKPPPPPPEKKKKKPLRYPAEDMDVVLPERDKKAGAKVQRPIPSRELPFRDTPESFEPFLMTWNYLNVYGAPLHLSTFTLDEFEAALRHNTSEPPCALIAEIHATLIYNLRTVPSTRQTAITSLLDPLLGNVFRISPEVLTDAMLEVGNNWERVPLRATEGREGWEEALVGCLTDLASVEAFPLLQHVLTRLLFEPVASDEPSGGSPSSRTLQDSQICSGQGNPSELYWTMPIEYKIALLSFMCGLSVSSKAIHLHMESCEEQLTALRKEKIEINRSKKHAVEEISNLTEGQKKDGKASNGSAPTANGNGNAVDRDVEMQDSSDLSDAGPDSGATSETSSVVGSTTKRSASRSQSLRRKAQAKQREISRSNAASTRKAAADLRKLEEEVNKFDRRLEAIEREFRKLLGCIRAKPMGKDRFHNRIWWFDGLGSGTLVASGGGPLWGTGRVFIQGPSGLDRDLLDRREAEDGDVKKRRLEEEGANGMLEVNEWAAYSEPEQVEELVVWLNTKGIRENALKNNMTKWMPHITAGIRKRLTDLATPQKLPEARRSSRSKGVQDGNREPYMSWTNRRAANNSS